MKLSNRPKFAAGTVLLLLAAFFSISLILQPLDFGAAGPGRGTVLFTLGQMLYSVYGFSSTLIPVFLLAAALSCFASKWTVRKAISLLTAVIPFFTAVLTENICRTILKESSHYFPGIKVALTAIIGLMLIIIEFMAAGILAYRISEKLRPKGCSKNQHTDRTADSPESAGTADAGELHDAETEETDISAAQETDDSETDAIIDDAKDESGAADTGEAPAETADETDAAAEDKKTVTEETAGDPFDGIFDEKPENPGSIITQEEYAALTDLQQQDIYSEENESTADDSDGIPVEEIDWPATSQIKAQAGNAYEADCENTASPEPQEEDAYSDAAYIASAVNTDKNSGSDETMAAFEDFRAKPEETEYSDDIDVFDISSDFEETADEEPADESIELEESSVQSEENEAPEEMTGPEENPADSGTLDPDFFDIDINAETEDEITAETEEDSDFLESTAVMDAVNAEDMEADEPVPEEFNEETVQTAEISGTPADLASDIFADMEADARKSVSADINTSGEETFCAPKAPEAEIRGENTDAAEMPAQKESPEQTAEKTGTALSDAPLSAVPLSSRAAAKGPYKIPSSLLTAFQDDQYWVIDEETKQAAQALKETLNEFNIEAEIIGIKKGPVVTMFELFPAPGVKLSKIATLQDNIALRLAASSVRIVAPIPGKAAVGIEVPNKKRSIVSFREIIEQELNEYQNMAIPVILGKDILGKPQLLDLVKTPHLLIAGATGSGKSVCVNSMILSILYKRSPQQVKMILIDPKIVELKLYNDIPHLLTPVITEPKKAFQSLQYCLCEMERRYALLDGMGVRDITSYNKRIEERNICTEKLPYIVVIIDEFADLMATTGKELESTLARLAAMSRAVGIHLVLATQRPSIDVITGLIKANIPSRIAFMVASKMDSRIIIDQVGAEMLLGRGDMLYASSVDPFPVRIQGTFVSDNDVENVVDYVKQYGSPEYIDEEIFVDDDESESIGPSLFGDGEDPLYEQALDIVIQAGKASASYIQRRLKIGYNRAARLVEEMEDRGIVGPANGSKPREIVHVPN